MKFSTCPLEKISDGSPGRARCLSQPSPDRQDGRPSVLISQNAPHVVSVLIFVNPAKMVDNPKMAFLAPMAGGQRFGDCSSAAWVSEELVLTLVESGVHAGQKVKDAWLKKIRRMDGSLASSSSPSLFCSAEERVRRAPVGGKPWQVGACQFVDFGRGCPFANRSDDHLPSFCIWAS